MKTRLLALCLMTACLSGISAHPPHPPQQQPGAWAEKMFGPPTNLVHDFGTVPIGTQMHHDFVVTNIYAVPIEITNIRASMSPLVVCTNKHVLQPNEKAIISVQMDGRRFNGKKSASIYVTFGPTSISQVALTVKAVIRDDIICNPGEMAFGYVAPGLTPDATVDVEYAGAFAWQVSQMILPKEAPFEAELKELYRRPGQVGYQVKVTLKKDAAPGPFQQTLFLMTNEPKAGLVPVRVSGNIQAPLEAVRARLDLKAVKGGEKRTWRVFIRSPYPFRIVGLEGPDAVRLGEPPQLNELQTVTLEILPPRHAGPFHYELKIKTDVQDAPVAVVIDGVVSMR